MRLQTMFRTLFAGKSQDIDASAWHPDLDAALGLYQARDWTALSLLAARRKPESRLALVAALGEALPLDSAPDKFPHTPALLALLGGVQTVIAWRRANDGVMGAAPPDPGDLAPAGTLLADALAMRDQDSVALSFLGLALTGQADTDALDETQARFQRLPGRPIGGCMIFLMARSPAWGGSLERLFDCARRCVADETLHPARFAVFARAQVERWRQDREQSDASECSPGAIQELVQLDNDYRTALRRDPAAAADAQACRIADDNIGFALFLAGRKAEAAAHVGRLGARPSKAPWSYALGPDVAAQWPRLRKSLGLSRKVKA